MGRSGRRTRHRRGEAEPAVSADAGVVDSGRGGDEASRADVPESLREAWAKHRHAIISEDGTKIDFGSFWDEDERDYAFKYFTEVQLREVTDAFVMSLLSPKVTSINLEGCVNVTDVCVKAIAARCRVLDSLNVTECLALTHESIKAIPARCFVPECFRETWEDEHKDNILSEDGTKIDFGAHYDQDKGTWIHKYTYEEMGQVTGAFVVSLLSPTVTSINLLGCRGWGLNDFADTYIKAIGVHCHSLEALSLHGTLWLSDEAIKAIAANCPSLKSLNLLMCGGLGDESMKAIAANCPSLTSLTAFWCERLTDESVKEIAAYCPTLTSLNVHGCWRLTDESIKAIAANCSALKSLKVNSCRRLTDESITAIAANCAALTSLDVDGCEHLTDESIKAIAENCLALVSLNVEKCPEVSIQSFGSSPGWFDNSVCP